MPKTKPNEKNMHAGHRLRVLKSYSQIDLDTLSPHQVLELILFYIFPRGDVNPLAHRLLKKFSTVKNVLDARPDELATVYGVNKRSAQMIAGFVRIFDYYTASKLSRKQVLDSTENIIEYCKELLSFSSNVTMFAIALDAKHQVFAKREIKADSTNVVSLDTRLVFQFANETNAAYILLCHSHPDGSCEPSQNDVLGNEIVKGIITSMGVKFVDHLIVGVDGVFSMENRMKIKEE